jgi:hypothetical protein
LCIIVWACEIIRTKKEKEMSGGQFEYRQRVLKDLREELVELFYQVNTPAKLDYDYSRFDQVEDKEYFNKIVHGILLSLDTAFEGLQRIDWFISGDDSEENFQERLNDWSFKYEEMMSDFEKVLQYKP